MSKRSRAMRNSLPDLRPHIIVSTAGTPTTSMSTVQNSVSVVTRNIAMIASSRYSEAACRSRRKPERASASAAWAPSWSAPPGSVGSSDPSASRRLAMATRTCW